MPDLDISQLAGSLLPQMTGKQLDFVTKYLDKGYYAKSKSQTDQFNRACAAFVLNLGRVRGIVDQLAVVGRTKADFDMVADLRLRTGAVLSGLAQKASSASKALERVEQADRALAPIATEALRYVNTLASTEGRDIGREAAIEAERLTARARYLDLDGAFGLALATVAERLREVAPNEPFNPEAMTFFVPAFRGYSAEINAVRSTDPAVTPEAAKQIFGGIKTRMGETSTTATQMLNSLADSPAFAIFLADMKLKDGVVRKLAETDDWLITLDRWETAARDPIRDEAERIRSAMAAVFADRAAMSPEAIQGLEAAQRQLLTAASTLARRAGSVAQAEAELFAQDQQMLLQTLVALEQRLAKALSKMSKDQRGPVTDALASARLAITGLNGCNFDALKAGRGLLDVAAAMVADAENITEVNAGIKTALEEARKEAVKGSKETNPLHAAFAEAVTEIDTFSKDWKTKVVSEAKAGAEALAKKVTDLGLTNTAIITQRAEVARIIERADEMLVNLNLAFKGIAVGSPAAGMDYSGALLGELAACKSWNATKTQLEFYGTIRSTLNILMMKIGTLLNDIVEISKMSDSDVMLAGIEADRVFKQEVDRLTALSSGGVPDPAKLADAQKARDDRLNFLNTKLDLLGDANDTLAAQKKDAEDREKFLSESKQLETDVGKEQKAAGKKDAINTYDDEVQRHLGRLKATRDLIRKNDPGASGATALSELGFVKAALDNIRKRGVKTSKSDLGAIRQQWEDEVGKFDRQAALLMDAVKAFEQTHGVGKAAAPEIQNVLTRVVGQMNAHRFAEPAVVLGSETSTLEERKSAREKALDEVRRLRKVIFEDQVIQQCVLNPFGIGGLGNSAQYRLEEIELNVLRGV